MKYKLTVIKYEKNENYEAEMAKWKDNNGYGMRCDSGREMPTVEVAGKSLEVFLTEEEFKKVKAETIKIFE